MERPFSAPAPPPTPAPASVPIAAAKNVRVVVRVRPPNASELFEGEPVVSVEDDGRVVRVKRDVGSQLFEYDKVFDMYTRQSHVYSVISSGIIEDLFKGISGCVLAYGQTGAGKTYTMMGADGKMGDGVMPKMLTDLYTEVERRKEENPQLECSILMSFLEVYMDYVYDLLGDPTKHINNRHETVQEKEERRRQKQIKKSVRLVKVREELNIFEAEMTEAQTLKEALKQMK